MNACFHVPGIVCPHCSSASGGIGVAVVGGGIGLAGSNSYPATAGSTGWICPLCGKGVSPFATNCLCRDFADYKITSTSDTK